MSSRYPAIPDVGDTLESVAESVRTLKLWAEVAANAAQKDDDSRFIRREELAALVEATFSNSLNSNLGFGYYANGAGAQNLVSGWQTITNDAATKKEYPPPGIGQLFNANSYVGLEAGCVYVFTLQFDCSVGNQVADFEVRLNGGGGTAIPYQDSRYASRQATVRYNHTATIAALTNITLYDYVWQIQFVGTLPNPAHSINNVVMSVTKIVDGG